MTAFRVAFVTVGISFYASIACGQFETILLEGQFDSQHSETLGEIDDGRLSISNNGRMAIVAATTNIETNDERDAVWVRNLEGSWSVVAGMGITAFDIDDEETSVHIKGQGELLFDEAQFGNSDGVAVGLPGDFTTLAKPRGSRRNRRYRSSKSWFLMTRADLRFSDGFVARTA